MTDVAEREIQDKQQAADSKDAKANPEQDHSTGETAEPDPDSIVTFKDLCKVVRTDIKVESRKKKLLDLVYFSAGCVLGVPEYRQMLQKVKEKEIPKKIQEILDLDKFRREFVELLSQQVNLRAQLPHYVILLGQDLDQMVKYSRATLLQVLICKKYALTMFEVPSITINTIRTVLTDASLKPVKKADGERLERLFNLIKVQEIDHFASDDRITEAFKDVWPAALKDTIKFVLCQSMLPKEKQDKERLNSLSSLMLSRKLLKITEFKDDEKTSDLGTAYNWSVIMGEAAPVKSEQYTVNTSHAIMKSSTRAQVLYYQKLECTFATTAGQNRKCQCVIYCQKVETKRLSGYQMLEQVRENMFSLETLYYVVFCALLLGFIVGGKACADQEAEASPEDQLRRASGLIPERSFREAYCDHKDWYTLNAGGVFLVFAAVRKMYNNKLKQEKRAK